MWRLQVSRAGRAGLPVWREGFLPLPPVFVVLVIVLFHPLPCLAVGITVCWEALGILLHILGWVLLMTTFMVFYSHSPENRGSGIESRSN